ncbi:heparan sulfate 2-O-sulfotransferase pipe [Eurytemora carolleeae]|uniref:heparan sulfate 2-O-sulfotransferase pipe n=2 Tax=Eurytemora carolleeae TaxID=1294199 RepID=UPI000C789272|nr:heparan sulfate 2-O-sulfotransferase pipe [Eurytemora carolleeae]|eukprot:XP_023348685.1 heparan sulfate 2-O-sulfotransferase pipe-like [Eurytemora affinis]
MPIYYMELEALQIMITVSEKILFFNKSRTFFIQIFLFRFSEIVALVSLSTTFFLFIHTRDLNIRLAENAQFEASVSGSASAIGQGESSLNKDRRIEAERLADLELYGKLDPMELNNTRKAVKETLFFNRVPKVGSQTTMELLKSLAIKNNFHYHKDRTQKVETIKLSNSEQKHLSKLVNSFSPPSVYVKHVCFTNFTKYGLPMPIYVNMVRDPVERVISWYYYVRAPWYFVERKRAFPDLPLPNPNWLRKDFETCVRTNDPECRYLPAMKRDGFGDHRRQTMFFCGHEEDCTGFNTEVAMKKAKENVERHYAVVGVLEELNKTLTVLEHYVPRFFKGALETYWNEVHIFSKINRNLYKPKVEEATKDIVRQNFTRELEFFDFCKQRLHKQYLAITLNQDP